MNPTSYALAFAIGLFIGMTLLLEVGRRLGRRCMLRDPEASRQGFGVVEGAVFSLLGLLIAFTFSGAAGRFDHRKQLIIEEANDIGTAYLRIDLVATATQPTLRELFRQYLDSRLETYQKLPDLGAAKAEQARSIKLQGEIWTAATAACHESGLPSTPMLLVPALNQMFDIVTTRTEIARIHPPLIIFGMLGVLTLASSLLAGYGMANSSSRSWIHILVFAAVMSITVYVIIDIEYPRLGFIRIEDADRVLLQLRETMK